MVLLPSVLALVVSAWTLSSVSALRIPGIQRSTPTSPKEGVDNFGMFPNGSYYQDIHGSLIPEDNCHTNAECMRKRMPLLKPRKPSRTRTAHLARRSAEPPVTYVGYFQVFDTSGNSMGYLKHDTSVGNYGQLVQDQASAEVFEFSASPDGETKELNMQILNPYQTYEWACFALGGGAPDDDMRSDNADNAFITTCTTKGAAGDTPNSSHNPRTNPSNRNSETAGWIFDPSNNAIKSMWIDTQGEPVYTHFMYSDPGVFLIAASTTEINSHGANYVETFWKYVPET